MSLLVVAGEASGDALAAPVVARLGCPAFGLGGPALELAGLDAVADLRSFAAMGLTAVAQRSARLGSALGRLVRAVRAHRPRAALLVGFSEPNAWLARWLARRGVRTLWYAPPQIWAWRSSRAPGLARACAHLALVLPFEEPVWRRAGARATYVGHPAAELPWLTSSDAQGAPELALLPGSRPHEVRAHLTTMLAAARLVRTAARLVLAPSLDPRTASWARREAAAAGAAVSEGPLTDALHRAGVALVCSGTATLEAAALGVPPVILYRTDPVTFAVARRLVRVPHLGLPNLVLGRRSFPELLQSDVTPGRIARVAEALLGELDDARARCAEVRSALLRNITCPPAERVTSLLRPWLA